nr:hypothetical protein GCM10020092_041240 [Actinoplanes digitatis]
MVAEGFHFPNGVALTPEQDALLVCETVSHRLLRISLPDGAVRDLGDLPAYPDNMSSVGDGTYWIALASPRVAIAEKLLPHPHLRRIAAVLPARLQPQPLPYTIAALVDSEGTVLRTLHGPAEPVRDDDRRSPAWQHAVARQPHRECDRPHLARIIVTSLLLRAHSTS